MSMLLQPIFCNWCGDYIRHDRPYETEYCGKKVCQEKEREDHQQQIEEAQFRAEQDAYERYR